MNKRDLGSQKNKECETVRFPGISHCCWSWSLLYSHTSFKSILYATSLYLGTSSLPWRSNTFPQTRQSVNLKFLLHLSPLCFLLLWSLPWKAVDPSCFYSPQHSLTVSGWIRFGKIFGCETRKLRCVIMLTVAVNLFCLKTVLRHWKLAPVLTAWWSSMVSLLASLGFHQNYLGSSHWHLDYSLRFWNWFHLLNHGSVKKWS